VICDDGANGLIHVSGHGCQEEMRLLINLVRPKFFIPVHGDYRNLAQARAGGHGDRRRGTRHCD
jgi:ribonuclease J